MFVPEPTEDARQPFSSVQREQLILENLNEVSIIAHQLKRRLPLHVDLQDLVSAGTLGLISSVDKFNSAGNVGVRAFAGFRIRGAMLDSLRRLDWAPHMPRKRAKRIAVARAAVERRLCRTATDDEIAAELKLAMKEYREWQVDLPCLSLARLESGGSGDSEHKDLMCSISGNAVQGPSAILERKELRKILAMLISELPSVEKMVLSLYYNDELTCREIAPALGVHESRVSQLKSQAIRRIRSGMAELWPAKGQTLSVVDSDAVVPKGVAPRKPQSMSSATRRALAGAPHCAVGA